MTQFPDSTHMLEDNAGAINLLNLKYLHELDAPPEIFQRIRTVIYMAHSLGFTDMGFATICSVIGKAFENELKNVLADDGNLKVVK